jgi:NAD(P)-dependent dehydrogenase (short-subunit alcohol dehydrogenase family)
MAGRQWECYSVARELNRLFSLDGKVIVITGAVGLLGQKHAEAIAAYGGIPILLDLSRAAVEKVAGKLEQQSGVEAVGFAVDITIESQIEQNAATLLKRFGKIDGLVNNAANNPKIEGDSKKNFSRLEKFPVETWNQDIAVGLTGAFLCAKYYGSAIARNSLGGSIVNISSDLGLVGPDQRLYSKEGLPENQQPVKPITYSVIKTGIIGLTKYLATYWAEQNVRCNAICPGGVKNDQPENFLKEVSSRIPMNRLADSDEYQGTLLWMLSDASSYLNGAIVSVDGGRTTW